MPGILKKTRTTLEMIKWEHSIFALPFALTGMLLAAHGLPAAGARWAGSWWPWFRRARRPWPSTAGPMRIWTPPIRAPARAPFLPACSAGKFVLGFTCMARSPSFCWLRANSTGSRCCFRRIVLVVLLGYSYLKRITRWSHVGLGLALGLAPAAAWIAVRGSLDPRILVLTAAVTLWAGGFDVLYACQDYEHDRQVGLNSLPQAHGLVAAFWTARLMHLAMLGLLVYFGELFHFRTLRAGSASPPWGCCWPMSTPLFRRATCAA